MKTTEGVVIEIKHKRKYGGVFQMMAGCDNNCGGAIPVSENSSLHGALNYAARGWFVFPGLAFGLMFLGVAVGEMKLNEGGWQ